MTAAIQYDNQVHDPIGSIESIQLEELTNITGCCQTSLAWYVYTGAITIITHYAASTIQWEWLLYSKLVSTF